ncbi:CLUMA_CG017871, isoform A [Clunio marinus]|uniref:CLUMA_CG017871, isoform A n=1 Tax=Clunio marinus TaxID=568069 RepID=A0A1J1IYP6_9DIPT|nr:CLUMA_CG017871, isoform A [Clunio marinus]
MSSMMTITMCGVIFKGDSKVMPSCSIACFHQNIATIIRLILTKCNEMKILFKTSAFCGVVSQEKAFKLFKIHSATEAFTYFDKSRHKCKNFIQVASERKVQIAGNLLNIAKIKCEAQPTMYTSEASLTLGKQSITIYQNKNFPLLSHLSHKG